MIERSQYIDPVYLDSLKAEKAASRSVREGEMMRVASVPTALVDSWLARGIPFWEMSNRQIVALLQAEGLDDFITTSKQV